MFEASGISVTSWTGLSVTVLDSFSRNIATVQEEGVCSVKCCDQEGAALKGLFTIFLSIVQISYFG